MQQANAGPGNGLDRIGKCKTCKVVYRWPDDGHRLAEHACATCGATLVKTTRLTSLPWREARGADLVSAAAAGAIGRAVLAGPPASAVEGPRYAFEVVSRFDDGNDAAGWRADCLGENGFETEAEAIAGARSLAGLGREWAEARYGVRRCGGSRVDEIPTGRNEAR
jgi:hypothetical protein